MLANETARRLACDAIVETAVYDDCQILGVGRKTRSIPVGYVVNSGPGTVAASSRGCHHTRFVHDHHIKHWADGGLTNLDNLVLLCGYHHRFLHEHHWSVEWDDAKPVFHRADPRIYPPKPPELHPQLRKLART